MNSLNTNPRLPQLEPRISASGNVLFAVFGAVMLVGLLGAGVTMFVKGPLTNAIKQTRVATAKAQMTVAAQSSIMSAMGGNAVTLSQALVFMTSTTTGGNIGGLNGADTLCQTRAETAGLTGTYKAWLSDATDSPSTRFVKATVPYKLTDGATIANNWTDLTDGTLAAQLNKTETGTSLSGVGVWTGTNQNGTTTTTDNCSNWTSSANSFSGVRGSETNASGWSNTTTAICNGPRALYCFQQPGSNTSTQGDCDGDGITEPLEYRAAGAKPAPAGGGLIPSSIGINKIDPWGTEYGYCVWDYGGVIKSASCQQSIPGTDQRLEGYASTGDTPIVAVVSAGPDRKFTTTCRNFSTGATRADQNNNGVLTDSGDLALIGKASPSDDDLIFTYSNAQASAATGGLWALKPSNTSVAYLNKKIESLAAKFSGVSLFQKIGAASGDYVEAVSGMRLPSPISMPACTPFNTYALRRNSSSNGMEMCNGTAWVSPSSGSSGGGTFDGLSDAITDTTNWRFFAGNGSGSTGTNTALASWGIGNFTIALTQGDSIGFGYQAMKGTNTGSSSGFGYQALMNNTGAGSATAFGFRAAQQLGASSTTFVAFGSNAAYGTAVGSYNVSFGANSGNSAQYNTGFGNDALRKTTTNANTAVGFAAMYTNTTGGNNVALGNGALYSNVTGACNTAAGSGAMYSNTASFNTAAGYFALYSNTSGVNNTAMGAQAAQYATGSYNTAVGYQSMMGSGSSTTGGSNTAFGYKSLTALTSGAENVAFGNRALLANMTGNGNTAVGYSALATCQAVDGNTAVGSYALSLATTSGNTALGSQALKGQTTGAGNTAIGWSAGVTLTDSSKHVIIGDAAQSLNMNSAGSTVTAIGYQALRDNKSPSNTAAGMRALMSNQGGSSNTALGYQALTSVVSGSNNTALGSQALVNTLQDGNTAIGYQSLKAQTTSLDNTAAGYQAGVVMTTGSYNTLAGYRAGAGLKTGSNNTGVGYQALAHNVDESNNTAVGYKALAENLANNNTALGYQALALNTTGAQNTAVGYNSITINTTGTGNTAVGSSTLAVLDDTTGYTAAVCDASLGSPFYNDATTGHCYYRSSGATTTWAQAKLACEAKGDYLVTITSADEQSKVASVTMQAEYSWIGASDINTEGQWKWATGEAQGQTFWQGAAAGSPVSGMYSKWGAGEPDDNYSDQDCGEIGGGYTWFDNGCTQLQDYICERDPVYKASYNTAIGMEAMTRTTTGARNTAVGSYALDHNTTGSDNTAIGLNALNVNTTGSMNTAIGAYSGTGTAALSNATAIGYNAQVTASNSIRVGDSAITVIEGQVAFTATSDARVKKDIQPSDLGLDFIMHLKPVSYRLKQGNGRLDYGFLAQDMEASLDGRLTNMITRREDEMRTYQLRSSDLIAPLAKAIQEQDKIIQRLQEKIDAIKKARSIKACNTQVPEGEGKNGSL